MKGNPPEEKPYNQQNDGQIHVVTEMEIKTLTSFFTHCIDKN